MLDLLTDNWLWLVLGGLFVWLHTRHGGFGAHHGHEHEDRGAESPADGLEQGPHSHVGDTEHQSRVQAQRQDAQEEQGPRHPAA
jgi:hypothetical protein